jgi:hypothetical protein
VGDSVNVIPELGLWNPSWLDDDEMVRASPTDVLIFPDDDEALDVVLFRLLTSAHSAARSVLDCFALGRRPLPDWRAFRSELLVVTEGDGDVLRETSREFGSDG